MTSAPNAFDVDAVRRRLEAGNGGYEVVHASPGLELGVYVLVAPEPDRQQPHADDELYVVLEGQGVLTIEGEAIPVGDRTGRLRACGRRAPLHGVRGPERARHLREGVLVTALERLDAYWRAANYLSVGQIYLLDNPLLREPLRPEHVKPRLLGHFGTTPGLNLVYAHLNRAIRERDLSALYIAGPGHGGPGLVANAYLEGTYSEVYPRVGRDEAGLRELFRQFSFPAGSPATSRPRRRARSTRAASSATRSHMRTARPSTTPTSSSRASSATARRRPARSPRAGTRTSSSTRSPTAPCCRSCT